MQELHRVPALLRYSDGSVRKKQIDWDPDTVCFDRPGACTARGTVSQQSFRFPLAEGYGDPVVFRWEGRWYYISTNDNLDDIGLYVREADSVDGLFEAGVTEHLISAWPRPKTWSGPPFPPGSSPGSAAMPEAGHQVPSPRLCSLNCAGLTPTAFLKLRLKWNGSG